MTVIDALTKVMQDVQAVRKADRNTHANYNFRGIDAVVNAVGPALRTHGVVVVPTVDQVAYEQVQTSQGKPANACRVQVTYTFWHDDTSLSTSVAAEAWDHGDKAAPKAMSVAFRTALLQALALPTDEPDPDSHTYERADEPAEPATDKGRVIQRLHETGVLDRFPDYLGEVFGPRKWDELDDEQRAQVVSGLDGIVDQLVRQRDEADAAAEQVGSHA